MLIENNEIRIECRPELGGKIISFFQKEKKFELAARTDRRIEELPPAKDSFVPYAFGMDDAFPNIDAEEFVWKGKVYDYPDHGEIWKAKFEVTDHTGESVSMHWRSPQLGYYYRKTLRLEGSALCIRYHIVNEGPEELPCLWTWHGLMRYEEDMEVILPEGITHCRNVLDDSVLGKAGLIYPLRNSQYDFSKVPETESRSMVKFYAEESVRRGRCGLRYPSQDTVCMLEYEAEKLPFFGFWVTAGGFQGDYNCALEPANGFYDSISVAANNGKLPLLAVGEKMEFGMKITLE